MNGRTENPKASRGRLEAWHEATQAWSSVCDDGPFGDRQANVVCRQLGLLSGVGSAAAVPNAAFGEGTGDVLFDDVVCSGAETQLQQCSRSAKRADCTHREDVGVSCARSIDDRLVPSMRLRLAGRPGSTDTGRVEVEYFGTFGTVSGGRFGLT